MTITIQLNSADDVQLLEPLLVLFRERGVHFTIGPASNGKRKKRAAAPQSGAADRLHGILKLPESFDYKAFVAEELLNKYEGRG